MIAVRRVLAGVLVALSLVPLVASAQSMTDPICQVPRTTYAFGSRGAGVSAIQAFLVDLGFLSAEPTGYFGRLTENAVAQFQLSSGIISDVNDGGVFGRRTWLYVAQRSCSPSQPPPQTRTDINICPAASPRPMDVSCDSGWQRIMTDQNCHVGWSCVTYMTTSTTTANVVKRNFAPAIYAIQGPLSVTVGNAGTWVIRASDQENDKLTYSIIWGDEGANLSRLLDLSGEGTNYSTSNSYTHKYTTPGVYTIIAYVKDEPGNTNKATISVTVSNPAPAASATSTATTTTPAPTGPDTCTFNGISYAANATIRNPICSTVQSTCTASRYLKCVNKNWVPTNDPGTVTGEMCVMNGRGYAVGKIYGDDAVSYGDPDSSLGGCRASGDTTDRCAPSDKYVCGSAGWHGPRISGTPRAGCLASNLVFISIDARVYGNCVSQAQGECSPGYNNTRTGYYVCKADGWWIANPAGTLIRITTTLPNIEGYF